VTKPNVSCKVHKLNLDPQYDIAITADSNEVAARLLQTVGDTTTFS
jgi:hypothetical protein